MRRGTIGKTLEEANPPADAILAGGLMLGRGQIGMRKFMDSAIHKLPTVG
jgi:hypothetical protein